MGKKILAALKVAGILYGGFLLLLIFTGEAALAGQILKGTFGWIGDLAVGIKETVKGATS